MPQVTVNLLDKETSRPITSGVFLIVQRDVWGEGFREEFRRKPDKDGKISWNATSITKYRCIADGTDYHSDELLIDTGWDPLWPIEKFMYLEKKLLPTPPLRWNPTRDIGLGQIMPLVLIAIAGAIIAVAVAYSLGKVPDIKLPEMPAKEPEAKE